MTNLTCQRVLAGEGATDVVTAATTTTDQQRRRNVINLVILNLVFLEAGRLEKFSLESERTIFVKLSVLLFSYIVLWRGQTFAS